MENSAHPLKLPEILSGILSVLQCQRTLAAAVRVNKFWFQSGISVLWKNAPCTALAAVGEDRRQTYASHIQKLSFSGDDECALHESFKDLSFHTLKMVSLDAYRPSPGPYYLEQYFSPVLEVFLFYGGDIGDENLDALRERCPKLRHLLFDNAGSGVTPAGFSRFLSGSKSVNALTATYNMSHLVTEDAIFDLAARSGFVQLAIQTMSQDLVARISSAIPKPFASLNDLQVDLASASIPTVMQMVPNLTCLSIGLLDRGEPVLQHIAKLPALEELSISYHYPADIAKAEILSLKRMQKLTKLQFWLNPASDGSLSSLEFSDAAFEELVSELEHLKVLSLDFQSNLTVTIFHTLARYCPNTTDFSTKQIFAMEGLGYQATPMFPNLKCLEIHGFKMLEQDDSDNMEYVLNPCTQSAQWHSCVGSPG